MKSRYFHSNFIMKYVTRCICSGMKGLLGPNRPEIEYKSYCLLALCISFFFFLHFNYSCPLINVWFGALSHEPRRI